MKNQMERKVQNSSKTYDRPGKLSRRTFMEGAAVGAAAMLSGTGRLYAEGSDKIRLGLIGCGGRGIHDTTNCIKAAPNVALVAMGDLFADRLESSLKTLRKRLSNKVKVTGETSFVGWDAYKKVLTCDVDMVILTTAPHFRPEHLRAAINAGKHVFMEKPVAVDPVGVRSVIESAELAEKKKLTIVAGTQSRRMTHIVALMKRIHDGALGKITGGQCVRLGGGMLEWSPQTKKRRPEWSDMEWQLRRWLFMTWLSGDFITEMHVHNIDIMNWAMNSHPLKCIGVGGRQVRTTPEYGDVFDHFAVEFEYPDGVRVEYMGTQIDHYSHRQDERVVGTRGRAYIDSGNAVIEGQNPFKYDGPSPDPCIRQHADQIAAIRKGKRLNEGRRIAESTLTTIMGRMSAYTGRALSWDWALKASKLDLRPPSYDFGDLPTPPIAVPGKTRLI